MNQHSPMVASLDMKSNVLTLRDMIIDEMKILYPELKDYQIASATEKYISSVIDELKRALLRPRDPNNPDELAFNSSALEAAGRITYQGRKAYIYRFMLNSSRTRLYEVRFVGQVGKYQRIAINPIYEEHIMNLIDNETQPSLSEKERQKIQQDFNRIIPVNSASLTNFIVKTQQVLQDLTATPSNKGYRESLSRYLLAAKTLLSQIETIDDLEVIKEVWVTADSGRQYGRYNSLQRMSSQVREAALGPCWKYDFKVCSFSVILSLALLNDPAIRRETIAEYIRNRQRIRERIAREIGVQPKIIKEVFTQLGFGAKPINNPYMAIRQSLKSSEAYERLMNNQTFRWIDEDLRAANQVVLDSFPSGDFVGLLDCEFSMLDEDTGRKKTDSQRLAWIYQNAESYLMKRFQDYVWEQVGLEPLLTVHDGVYYGQPIPIATQHDLRYLLQQEFAYVNFEEEQVWPISTQDHYEHRFDDQLAAEQQHLERIAQEEQLAQGYRNDYMAGSSSQRTRSAVITEQAQDSQLDRAYTERIDPVDTEQKSLERYNLVNDPWYQDLTEDEQFAYQELRGQLTGQRTQPDLPDWVKQRIGVK